MNRLEIRDHCRSAADVLEAKRRVLARRREMRNAPPPPPKPPTTRDYAPQVPMPAKAAALAPKPLPAPVLELPPAAGDTKITMTDIVAVVCAYFHVTRSALSSPARNHAIVLPRQIAMYLGSTLTGRSQVWLGKFLKHDHTTVLHGTRVISAQINQGNEAIILAIREIRERIDRYIADHRPPIAEPVPQPVKPPPPSPHNWQKPYTPEETARLKHMFFVEHKSAIEIGEILGRSEEGIFKKLRKMGFRKRAHRLSLLQRGEG